MGKMEMLSEYKNMINDSICNNPYCIVGILDDRRIFSGYRKNKPELLVLVSSLICYGEVWGHVFWHKKSWVSCLTQITGWFGGDNEEQLITDYWKNIKKRAGWTYLSPNVAESYVARSNSLSIAVENLVKLISKLHPDAFSNDAEFNTDLYQVYGCTPLIAGSLYAK